MTAGGKREGAGRKSKFGEKTVALRIPISSLEFVLNHIESVQKQDSLLIIDSTNNQYENIQNQQLLAIKELIKTYESNINNSPRWAQAKELLKELNLILASPDV